MNRLVALWLMLIPLATLAAVDVRIDTLMKASQEVASGGDLPACSLFIESSRRLNAANLFYGAVVCAHKGDAADSALLQLLGQARAVTDMALYQPADDTSKERAGMLWSLIFFQFGGAGDDAIYRDPMRRDALFQRFEAWRPDDLDNYDPGWKAVKRPSGFAYEKAIEESKEQRRKQLENYSRLVSDARYSEAQRELEQIKRRNPQGIVMSTDDGLRANELTTLMRQLDDEINSKR